MSLENVVTLLWAVGIALLLAIALSVVAWKVIKRYRGLSLEASQEGYVGVDKEGAEQMIGMTGVAQTDLRPLGKVLVNGRLVVGTCDCGFIEKGTTVVVTRVNGGEVVVEQLKT